MTHQYKLKGNSQNVMYVVMFAIPLIGIGNMLATSAQKNDSSLIWMIAIPVVLLAGYLIWWMTRPVYLTIKEDKIIFEKNGKRTEHPLSRARLTYGRFTYPNAGAFGSILFLRCEDKLYRFARMNLLFSSEVYTEADGYSHDFMLEDPTGEPIIKDITNAMQRAKEPQRDPFRKIEANEAPPKALKGGYEKNFSIKLQEAYGVWRIMKYSLGVFAAIGALNLIIFTLEPVLGMMNAQFAGLAIFVPVLLYGIYSMVKGSSASFTLERQGDRIVLVNTKGRELAACTREELSIERGHYTMSTRGGTYTYPVVLIRFPQYKPIKLGSSAALGWGKEGRSLGSPSFVVGPPEFELFRKSLGL
jgi:hypothetical protein